MFVLGYSISQLVDIKDTDDKHDNQVSKKGIELGTSKATAAQRMYILN